MFFRRSPDDEYARREIQRYADREAARHCEEILREPLERAREGRLPDFDLTPTPERFELEQERMAQEPDSNEQIFDRYS